MTKPWVRSLPLPLLLVAACGGSELPIDASLEPDAASSPDAFVAPDAITPDDAGTDAFSPDAPRRPPLERVMTLVHRIPCPPAMSFRADGSPVVAVSTFDGFRVYQLMGETWRQVGADLAPAGSVVSDACPGLVVDGDDTIYVVYEQLTGPAYTAHIRHFDGTTWVDDETISPAAGHAVADIDVDLDASGDPVIGFLEPVAAIFGNGISIRRRVGGDFVRTPIFDMYTASELRIAMRPDDTVVAAITHSAGFSTMVRVLELSPADVWTTHDAADLVGDTTQSLAMTGVDADATRTWVTWIHAQSSGTYVTHLSELIGNVYRPLEPEDFQGGSPDVVHLGGDRLAWAFARDLHFEVRDFDGTGWGAPLTDPDTLLNIVSLHLDHGQLWTASTTTSGGGPDVAYISRLTFPE